MRSRTGKIKGTGGDKGYAQEQFVAEQGAVFQCADLGIALEDRADLAAYICSWLKVLTEDRRTFFSAAAAAADAQRAIEFLDKAR